MAPRFVTVGLALAITLACFGCSSATHECPIHGSERVEIPAGQSCPSAADAERAIVEQTHLRVSDVALANQVEQGPETLCWYRKVTDPPYPCVLEDRQRRNVLDRIGRWDVLTIAKFGEFCDGDEHVIAYPLPAPPGGLAECPSNDAVQDKLDLVSNAKISGLVGHDVLPARITCSYNTTTTSTCSSGGGRIPGLSPE